MYDPDYEAGRQGGVAPPNGDWGKFLTGSWSRDSDGEGQGCAFLILLLFVGAAALYTAPLSIGALIASVLVALIFRKQGLERSWLRTWLFFVLSIVATLALAAAVLAILSTIPPTYPTLSPETGLPTGPDRQEVLFRLAVVSVAGFYLFMMWLSRPLKSPSRMGQQIVSWVLSTLLTVTLGLAILAGTLVTLVNIDWIARTEVSSFTNGLLYPEDHPLADYPELR